MGDPGGPLKADQEESDTRSWDSFFEIRNWVRWIDCHIPDIALREADELRRARLAIGGVLIGILAFGVMTWVQSSRGSPVIAGVVLCCALALLAVLAIFRRTGSMRFLAHAMPGLLFGFALVIMIATGGQFVGALYASAMLIPLASVMLMGWRAGIAWTLVTAAATGVLLGAGEWRAAPMFVLDPARLEASNIRGTILMSFVSLGIAMTYEWLRTAAMDEVQRARSEVERYRRHLEERVEERTRELDVSRHQLVERQRLASIGTLAAGIAHQINNPVGGILAAAQYARSIATSEDGDPEVCEALTNIEIEAIRCGRIVHGLLQFARNEQTEKWPEDLNSVLHQAHVATIAYARERAGRVALIPSAEPALVNMHPIALEQVFINLIQNGLEAREEGAFVELATEVTGDRVSVLVRDNGDGIAEAMRPHVFDPFYTTRTSAGGTGLGLSVSHGIVREHGGQLRLDSEAGKQTTFIVELPLYEGASTDVPLASSR